MKLSGYDARYRYDIVKGVITRYKEMSKEVEEGERTWYRTRSQILDQKVKKGGRSAATWHLKGDITQTPFPQ